MQNVWSVAVIRVGLALVTTLLAIWLELSTALSEIVVGTVAQLVIGSLAGPDMLAGRSEWVTFLPGAGSILLTFLALWAGSEPVLPAYIIGMVLGGTVGTDHVLVRRLRTVTFGLVTPFFIRAASFVSVPILVAAPIAFVVLFGGKSASKFIGIWPAVRWFRYAGREGL
jgi:hypothetical protein